MNNGLSRSFYRETVRDSGVADEKIIRQRSGMAFLLTFVLQFTL